MNEIWKIFKNVLQHQTVQLVMGVIMAIGAFVSLYTSSREAPILIDLASLHTQANAQSMRLDALEKYVPVVIQTKDKVDGQQDYLIRIEGRVNSIDGFLRGYK